jgi:hypothetical protein
LVVVEEEEILYRFPLFCESLVSLDRCAWLVIVLGLQEEGEGEEGRVLQMTTTIFLCITKRTLVLTLEEEAEAEGEEWVVYLSEVTATEMSLGNYLTKAICQTLALLCALATLLAKRRCRALAAWAEQRTMPQLMEEGEEEEQQECST